MNKQPMETKEFLRLFFSFFWDKEFLFGFLYGIGIYTIVFTLWWLL